MKSNHLYLVDISIILNIKFAISFNIQINPIANNSKNGRTAPLPSANQDGFHRSLGSLIHPCALDRFSNPRCRKCLKWRNTAYGAEPKRDRRCWYRFRGRRRYRGFTPHTGRCIEIFKFYLEFLSELGLFRFKTAPCICTCEDLPVRRHSN